jgi:GNAT superfamily N-acetyltransferase
MPRPIRTKIIGLTLRFAKEDDVPVILEFIKELADYEKLSHEVVATEEKLKKSLFAENSFAEVIIAEYLTKPVGFCLFFHNYSTFLGRPGIYIEDIYIRLEHRGLGFGKSILTYLAKLALERDCGRIEWSVLDWNINALNFYNDLGASAMDGWTVYRIANESLIKLSKEF